MCSFCVVPFTRGRERSRDAKSIISEIERLVRDEGLKEVVLLGQNVNGFHDTSSDSASEFPENTQYNASSEGFVNLFQSKKKDLPGVRFSDLLLKVADISPHLRVRFTSPHPKDFPPDVLAAVGSRPNICASLHLPVQSGSTSVLARMRRGYSREAFLDLVHRARKEIPELRISTDIITGFCGETEEEHRDTLLLMEEVRFDQAFMFAYSSRDKTHAARTMEDDVTAETKGRRLKEIIEVFRRRAIEKNRELETGAVHLVLVEGLSTKATAERPTFTGRTDGNQRVVFDVPTRPAAEGQSRFNVKQFDCVEAAKWDTKHLSRDAALVLLGGEPISLTDNSIEGDDSIEIKDSSIDSDVEELTGKYVAVKITNADNTTLGGVCLGECSIDEWSERLHSLRHNVAHHS